jgi:hypothetical protein
MGVRAARRIAAFIVFLEIGPDPPFCHGVLVGDPAWRTSSMKRLANAYIIIGLVMAEVIADRFYNAPDEA